MLNWKPSQYGKGCYAYIDNFIIRIFESNRADEGYRISITLRDDYFDEDAAKEGAECLVMDFGLTGY